jgi:hypothetical protein
MWMWFSDFDDMMAQEVLGELFAYEEMHFNSY